VCRVAAADLAPYDRRLLSFFNINTPEDYRLAQELASQLAAGKKI
jgi:molybdopterin-guanine dinucleotide biosynthesis protein A